MSALNSEFGKIGVSFQACSELIDYYNDDLAVFDKESQGAYLAANCYDPNVINVY
ncbi:MAG: hypothetical protein IPN86_21080 [Saprospiraceae bacterium]|nr:hypothetical protein [Saprospiraceae bacterium]